MAQSNSLSPRRPIPIRRVALTDASQLPTDYSTTPGGTLFSTTPGGLCFHVYMGVFLSAQRALQ